MAAEPVTEAFQASDLAPNTQDLQVLILVGLPGSGKSCLANALESTGKWVRASQDDAPNRRRQEAEAMTRNALRTQRNAVVDRVGFDRKQRSHFIEIARESPNVRCTCVILDVKRETLETRLAARTGHPTLIDIDIAMRVLKQMEREYKPPRPDQPEGYSRVYIMPENEQPAGGMWSEADLEELLRKVETSSWRDEPYVPPPQTSAPYPRRGYAGGGTHGQPRQYMGSSGNQSEGNRMPRGGGYRNSSNHTYRPTYDNAMQGTPPMNAYIHPPFEGRQLTQYSQGGYDAGNRDRNPARPVYSDPDHIDNANGNNRSTRGYPNPWRQGGRWRPPQGHLHQPMSYPAYGNGDSQYQQRPPPMNPGTVVNPLYLQHGPLVTEQREPEDVPQ